MNSILQKAPSNKIRNILLTVLVAANISQSHSVNLADAPLYSTVVVPGNLALALSVEWPTATTPAYTTAYSVSDTFLGYFDPLKCYEYVYNSGTPANSYFKPNSYSTNTSNSHTCISTSSVQLWSGNFLNWVSMQTLDTFRWTLTGGYRSSDTTTQTILTKTYAGYNSYSVIPNKTISSAATTLTGATPLTWSAWTSRVNNIGTAVYFSNTGDTTTGYTADYNGHNSYVGNTNSKYANPSTIYRIFINVKVCDANVGLEDNCVAYGSNYKPEGLMQKYAGSLRYSAFGYYNHTGNRDGGVMRARMKYIAPTKPVPGSNAVTNSASEWNSTTGIMINNPDTTDANATVAFAANAGRTVAINNSGVMNYLNKFGYSAQSYKGNDPSAELFYAVTRYFRKLGNIPEYTTLASAGNDATAAQWLDGFPAITTWDDPIVYSCQKNFILGIGDTYSWYDGNLPGSTLHSGEPTIPALVTNDTTVNVKTATDMVGVLEGKTGTTTLGNSWNNSGRGNTMYIAGLAYAAHTSDIRSDLSGDQTINTYWLDVHEGQKYEHKNQYWLAAKYGGFAVPTGFNAYASTNATSTILSAAWHTSADILPFSGTTYANSNSINFSTDTGSTDPRPDNYFPGNSPATMKSSLTAAFAKIAAEASEQTTTGYSSPNPLQSFTGNANYVVSFNPKNWTSNLTGQLITYDSITGVPSYTDVWNGTGLLDARTSASRLIVTCCTTSGAALPFTNASLTGNSLNTRTYYASFGAITGVSSSSQSISDYIDYLRGSRTNELSGTGGKYRARIHLLGDIVDAKLTPVPAPHAEYFDVYNPGYSAFMAAKGSRPTVVFAGSNDGMLHAFDGTVPSSPTSTCTSVLSTPSTVCGKELFAYIPSFVYGTASTAATDGLASLGNPTSFSHRFLVDGTPVYADVDFFKTNAPTATSNDWRTILVGGLGKGGKGYYAIDITDPASWTSESIIASKVLWEFTAPHMGYSFGDAVIVKTPEFGWTVVVASGYNNDDGIGYFFLINPRTGALLKTIATPAGNTASPIDMAHLSAYIPSRESHVADAIYAGDLQGNVWRLDLTASTTTTGSTSTTSYNYAVAKIATLTDSNGTPQPVTTRPVVAADPNSGKRYVLIGTGKLLDDADVNSTQIQSFYAIIDGTKGYGKFYNNSTSSTTTSSGIAYPTGITPPVTRSDLIANTNLTTGISSSAAQLMGWYFDFSVSSTGTGVAEQSNVHPIENSGVVSFAANLPNGDACNPSGTGRAFAVSYADGLTALRDPSTGAIMASFSTTSSIMTLTNVSTPQGSGSNAKKGGTGIVVSNSGGGGGNNGGNGGNDNLGTGLPPVFIRLNWREIFTAD
jgi:type IV pilus assembly protein PilY1